MASLGFTREQVRDTISNPLWTRPNGRAHAQDRRVLVGDSLLVVWRPISNVVVTVMLKTTEPYHHEEHDRLNLPSAA